jgi:hypothetical protein
LRDLGRAKREPALAVNPALATLAVSVDYLVIAPNALLKPSFAVVALITAIASLPLAVSWYRTVKRIQTADRIAHAEMRLNGWLILVLLVVVEAPYPGLPGAAADLVVFVGAGATFFLLYWYVQKRLNAVWRTLVRPLAKTVR